MNQDISATEMEQFAQALGKELSQLALAQIQIARALRPQTRRERLRYQRILRWAKRKARPEQQMLRMILDRAAK